MSIKSKLLLVLGLVMGFLIFNMVQMSYESLSEKKRLAQTMTLIELSEKLSLFIHETQKERGMSAGFLGSSGKKFGDTLVSQRSLTDKTLKELFTFVEAMDLTSLPKALFEEITALKESTAKMPAIRKQIDAQGIKTKDAIAFYTQMNTKILRICDVVPKASEVADLVKVLASYANFLKFKELAGIERATLNGVFALDVFSPGVFATWGGLVTTQNAYTESFLAFATDDIKKLFAQKMQDPSIAEVEKYRAIALDKEDEGGFGVDPQAWFTTISKNS